MAEREIRGNRSNVDLEDAAEQAFSSEKREDAWALIIALVILLLSVAFPDQIRYFFSNTLYLF